MSINPSCDHARQCDKCKLFYCANDELITCQACCEPVFCNSCFSVKNQDPVMYEWYCNKNNCRIKAQERKQPCSNCKNNCVNHKKIIHNDKNEKVYLCRRCVWRAEKKKQRLSKKTINS